MACTPSHPYSEGQGHTSTPALCTLTGSCAQPAPQRARKHTYPYVPEEIASSSLYLCNAPQDSSAAASVMPAAGARGTPASSSTQLAARLGPTEEPGLPDSPPLQACASWPGQAGMGGVWSEDRRDKVPPSSSQGTAPSMTTSRPPAGLGDTVSGLQCSAVCLATASALGCAVHKDMAASTAKKCKEKDKLRVPRAARYNSPQQHTKLQNIATKKL